ncbi:MAG: curli-like amyloid fiber formation chaperone CsgH [Pseudomonadota bacterium]
MLEVFYHLYMIEKRNLIGDRMKKIFSLSALFVAMTALGAPMHASPMPDKNLDQDDQEGQKSDMPVIWIDHRVAGRLHTFVPMARLSPGDEGSYSLLIKREGRSGQTQNKQGGALPKVDTMEAEKVLSRSTVSIDVEDAWMAELILTFKNGRMLKATLSDDGEKQ